MAKMRACPYCSYEMRGYRRAPTIDHVTPKSAGGILNDANRLVVCRTCNEDKDNWSLKAWWNWLSASRDPRAERVERVLRVHDAMMTAWPLGNGNLAMSLAITP